MMQIFGTTTQATIIDKSVSVWCSLREDYLTISPADLLLQHGLYISGKWTVVGILDAKPSNPDPNAGNPTISIFADALAHIIPSVRNMLGRPNPYFGITPLLILREILR